MLQGQGLGLRERSSESLMLGEGERTEHALDQSGAPGTEGYDGTEGVTGAA